MSATIEYQLDAQHRVVYYQLGEEITALPAFAAVLQAYSRAGIMRITATKFVTYAGSETSGEIATTDLEAFVSLREQSTNKKYAVLIPAPINTMFEYITDRGYRVKTTDGQAIAAAYSIFAGTTLIFEHGWLRGNSP